MGILFFSRTSSKRGFLDDLSLPTGATVRHKHCQLLLQSDSVAVRCLACSGLRAALTVQATRMQGTNRTHSTPSNHINYRYNYNEKVNYRGFIHERGACKCIAEKFKGGKHTANNVSHYINDYLGINPFPP